MRDPVALLERLVSHLEHLEIRGQSFVAIDKVLPALRKARTEQRVS